MMLKKEALELVDKIPQIIESLLRLQASCELKIIPGDELRLPVLKVVSVPHDAITISALVNCMELSRSLLQANSESVGYVMGLHYMQAQTMLGDYGKRPMTAVHQALQVWELIVGVATTLAGLQALLERLRRNHTNNPVLWLSCHTACTLAVKQLAELRPHLYTWANMPAK